jgi:hypothetical protein
LAQQGEQSESDDPIFRAQRFLLDQLFESYPAHLSKDELTSLVSNSRISPGNIEDALGELLGKALIHRQADADFYWLTRPVVHIAELDWSATSV